MSKVESSLHFQQKLDQDGPGAPSSKQQAPNQPKPYQPRKEIPMPRKRHIPSNPQQLELPFDLPSAQPSMPAIQLAAGVFKNHKWEFVLEEKPGKITTGFQLPNAGVVGTGLFADDQDTSLMVFASNSEPIPEWLKADVAGLITDFNGNAGVNGKIFPDGHVRLIGQVWIPKNRTVQEVDHLLSPTLDSILRQADVIFPKISQMLTRAARQIPSEDDLGLRF